MTEQAEQPEQTNEGMKPLFAALLKAQLSIRGVEKDSLNAFHKYKYASAEAIIEEARTALLKAGLVLTCTRWSENTQSVFADYLLFHPESGCSVQFAAVPIPIVEDKGKGRDKSVATALTYNLGYFLRGLLLIPRVEEGTDVDQRDDSPEAIAKRIAHMDESAVKTVHGALRSRVQELKGKGPDGPGTKKASPRAVRGYRRSR